MSTIPTASTQTESAKLSVWHNRNYVILFLSGALLTIGGKVYELALPLILYTLSHHNAVTMTTMRAIEFLPNLLLALFIGVWVDRANKKRWTLTVVAGQATLLLILYLTYRLNVENLWIYYLAGFCLMTCQYAYGNARVSIVKHVLPRELLTAANANFSFISTLVGICGPAISGFLLMMSDLHTGLLLTACTYVLSWLIVTRLQSTEQVRSVQCTTSFWHDLREGWIALRGNQALWQITMLVVVTNSAAGMVDAISVFFAKDHLQLTNGMVGLLLAVEGVGGLVGSRLVAWCRQRFGTGRTLGMTMLLLGLCYGFLCVSSYAILFAIGLFGIGFVSTIQSVCIWTFRQETTPPELIGRISGLTGSIFKVGMVWTIFGSGWLIEWAGPWAVYGIACLLNLVLFAVYRRLPLRKLS